MYDTSFLWDVLKRNCVECQKTLISIIRWGVVEREFRVRNFHCTVNSTSRCNEISIHFFLSLSLKSNIRSSLYYYAVKDAIFIRRVEIILR